LNAQDPQPANRIALVTGASRGIGAAIATGLARAGAAVAVSARSYAGLEAVVGEIEALGSRALPVVGDVTDQRSVERMIETAEGELGPIDVLVSNAGVCEAVGPLWEVDPSAWWRDVEVGLRGAFLCARAVLPAMVSRRRGTIVNVASYNVVRPEPYLSGYAAGKAALVHLTGSLAAETEPHGIAVFAIAPGTVATALTRSLAESEAAERWLPRFREMREEDWLSPELAARLVVLLASGRADALSGRFLHALDDVEELIARQDEVVRDDLYALRLRK
jgi:NAD(P)-dependent dehydrogenase (short-subunit alcohol dehydrogenase family)